MSILEQKIPKKKAPWQKNFRIESWHCQQQEKKLETIWENIIHASNVEGYLPDFYYPVV